VYVAPEKFRIAKVAIMPFKAATELIGASVSDLFVTEMLKAKKFELVERSQMAAVLGESELALAGLSAAKAAEVGSMLGADAVWIGTVDEYGTVAYRGHPYPVVGITARLIHCESGRVVASVDHAARAETRDATLPQHARRVVHEMMSGLYANWRR
jgi:TolB-like protein